MKIPFFRMFAAVVVCVAASQAFAQTKPFDTARMDKTVSPCSDFFEYVNGTWMKNTQIPASETRWGTFNILGDSNNALLREILEADSKANNKEGSDAQLIGDFYSACMDEAAIEKAGMKPIEPFFRQIASIKDRSEERRVGKECRSRWSPYH